MATTTTAGGAPLYCGSIPFYIERGNHGTDDAAWLVTLGRRPFLADKPGITAHHATSSAEPLDGRQRNRRTPERRALHRSTRPYSLRRAASE
ncbi:hypothetical protein WOLCODRAFT_153744 [Wolfiporia cocos MD-104 SS10]|uniref:Uncharacterized protein n=1 Tax=Wolfiporia cocos (strain MD-104) TaxID=742152 RepID=A0A2H3JNE0_WOLCO|nr:hypothetical protein WOLCODRAFT_153744 [Wolfiporia cocos MD-104 SS10]